jgi:metal-dependent amidase/aminoacylase/carboxypeptidase family protein
MLPPGDDIARDLAALEPKLIETRRVLHRRPELALQSTRRPAW